MNVSVGYAHSWPYVGACLSLSAMLVCGFWLMWVPGPFRGLADAPRPPVVFALTIPASFCRWRSLQRKWRTSQSTQWVSRAAWAATPGRARSSSESRPPYESFAQCPHTGRSVKTAGDMNWQDGTSFCPKVSQMASPYIITSLLILTWCFCIYYESMQTVTTQLTFA